MDSISRKIFRECRSYDRVSIAAIEWKQYNTVSQFKMGPQRKVFGRTSKAKRAAQREANSLNDVGASGERKRGSSLVHIARSRIARDVEMFLRERALYCCSWTLQ